MQDCAQEYVNTWLSQGLSLDRNSLSPIFKWTGGKRREIKSFKDYFPNFIKNGEQYTYVEPFTGGGAVYWYLNNISGNNIINDFDEQVINFYEQYKENSKEFVSSLQRINQIKDHDLLEEEYYFQRNKDRNHNIKNISKVDQAIRFFVVNQLAFSGMRRFNPKGEFNVPFGHYKNLPIKMINSEQHIALLNQTDIYCGSFEKVILNNDKANTFIFLDPPYTRVFKEYTSGNNFGEKEHCRLAEIIKSIKKASVMLVIDKSEFTEKLYKGYIAGKYGLQYGVNIKNRFNTKVEHLIITNRIQNKRRMK